MKFIYNIFQTKVVSCLTESTAKLTSLSSSIEERRYVFIRFKAESDLSQDAVLTQIVRAICISWNKVGKASFMGESSLSKKMVRSVVLFASVRFASFASTFKAKS